MCRRGCNLQKSTLFFILFIVTILITRLSVFLVPEVNITFVGIVIHHFWFGVVLLLCVLFIPEKHSARIFLYGVGSGFFVDQLVFILLGAGTDAEYWSLPSVMGTVVLAGMIFFIRRKVIQFSLYWHSKLKK